MSTSDGSVLSTTKIVDNGPDAAKWTLVLLPDGYQSTEMTQWHTDAQDFVDALFAEPPFDDLDLRCAINVYRIDVTSTDSGADDPNPCGTDTSGAGTTAATYFDATFCADGANRRLLGANATTATNVANAQVPGWDQALVIVNSATYGGSGGVVGVTSTSGTWEQIAIHEIGHSAFGLADEYEYLAGCGSGETGHDTYTGTEPGEPNVTADSNRATIKWGGLINAATPMPTTSNANCAQCDTQGNPVAAATVGAFEGARYFHCGLFRPVFDCMMRNFAPFCAVCEQRIRQVLQPFVTPTTVTLDTPSLTFNDVPEGITTVRAVVFSVNSCLGLNFQIVGGPTVVSGPAGTAFTTPLGTSDVSAPTGPAGKARLWIGYTGTNDGDVATGTVTVRWVETGQEWTIPITANTVARPTVAVVLVLDQSNSMNFDAGDGRTRVQVLRDSATPFVDLIQEDNAIGVVAFDHDPYPRVDVTPVGPPIFGAGRTAARTAVLGHTPNPAGNTAIGDGVEIAHDKLVPVTGYDAKAMIVLTDGQETAAKYIADVMPLINDRVYAIGLGTAEQIQPAALTALTNGTGGYLLMTGTIDSDDYFRLSKYYLQILAGVTNTDIVLDPEAFIAPGQVHRIPFRLNEVDIGGDAILLSRAPHVLQFFLEAPDGTFFDPALAAATPGMSYIQGNNVSYYRTVLPVPVPGGSAGEGVWTAILSVDQRYFKRYLSQLEEADITLYQEAIAHGIRYSLSVHAFSNLRLTANLAQTSQEPGATLLVRAVLTEFGLPVENRATVLADLERPDATTATLAMSEVEPGVFEVATLAMMSGVYTFRVRASGTTLRGRPFSREQIVTGAVWRGGDDDLPSSDDPGARGEDICRLLRCLLDRSVIGDTVWRDLRERGIDPDAVRKCLEAFCRQSGARRNAEIGVATVGEVELGSDLLEQLERLLVRRRR